MPKAFSEREKEIIKDRLIHKGSEIFAGFGVRKTTIDDLAAAAGISKGAFYLFYESKEDLYMEILELFEKTYRQNQLDALLKPGRSLEQGFKEMLHQAFRDWKNHPLFIKFSKEDLDHLMLKLPAERMAAHFDQDEDFTAEILTQLKKAGADIRMDVKAVAGLMKGLFFVSIHEHDFTAGDFDQTLDIFINLVADYVFKGK